VPSSQCDVIFVWAGSSCTQVEAPAPTPLHRLAQGARQLVASPSPRACSITARRAHRAAPWLHVRAPLPCTLHSPRIENAQFCLAAAGWGWGGRMKSAVAHGCVPVVIQDGVRVEWEEQVLFAFCFLRSLWSPSPRCAR
jgi:hypothetical protein